MRFASTHRLALATLVLTAVVPAQTSDQDHAADNVFAQFTWHELGPVQSGGRIVDIAVHPQRPQVFWVAAGSGGIFQTTNGGVTFTPQFQDAELLSIGDLAVAPSNGDVLYVGTGEANNQRSSYWGNGVSKSTDGGKTWQSVGLNGTEHIGRIAIHPTNPDIVYVAALGALYSANDSRGLYKTTDGGKTWQRVHHRGPDIGFVDVCIDAAHPDTVYAASYERRRRAWNFTEGGEGSRLWKSTDAGANWEQLAGGLPGGVLGRIGIECFAGDSRVLYATIENLNPKTAAAEPVANPTEAERRAPDNAPDRDAASDDEGEPIAELSAELVADPTAFADWQRQVREAQDPVRRSRKHTVGGEVYRSDDAGVSWQKTNADDTDIGGNPAYYYGQIRIDPNDKDTVYVLSVPVYKSTDGGKTWSPSRQHRGGFADGLHTDHHALWLDPKDSRHQLLGNDGGLAVTWDGGDTWDHLTHLPILQYYTIATDLGDPYRVYGGLQDNGTWSFPIHGPTSSGIGALDAVRVDGGDGFYCCVDPSNADVVYSESQFGGMSRQDLRTGERQGIRPKALKGEQPLRFNWSTPIMLSPHAPHTVYTGSQFLHRSRDRGDTWSTISPDLTTNDPDKKKGNVPHCTITTIAESPVREGWLWVGTDDGNVWTSKDGGDRWTDLRDRFPEATRGLWVSRVEASPHAAETAFVSFTGYREDRREALLFRTDDGGDTWRSISNNLPAEPINVVRQHPRNPNVLLVGNEIGVYVSIDDGADWFRFGKDLPHVPVHDLIVHPRESHVLAATHGRGIWAMDAAGLEGLKPEHLDAAFRALPPSNGLLLRRSFSDGNTGARGWSAPNPFVQATFRYLLAQDSEQKVTIEVLDATGTVLWHKDGPLEAGYHEVPWQAERGGRGGFGQAFGGGRRGGRGNGNSGPRPGEFAVRMTCGPITSTQTFAVRDQRGTGSLLGGWPGVGVDGDAYESTFDVTSGEEAEAEEGSEAGEAEAGAGTGERRGGER